MPTECNLEQYGFARVEGRQVIAGFDGGRMSSDSGALLLGQVDRTIKLVDRFAQCFTDGRSAARIEHAVSTLVMQRVVGIALGYEDLNDHDELRHDPIMAAVAGELEANHAEVGPVAGENNAHLVGRSPAEGE